MARKRIRPERANCKACGNEFTPVYAGQICCSRVCGNTHSHRSREANAAARRTSTCKHCGDSFIAKALSRLTFCSRSCHEESKKAHAQHRKEWGKASAVVFNPCAYCGNIFTARRCGRIYCSAECRAKAIDAKRIAKIVRVKQRCPECNEVFVPEHNGRMFCSRVCLVKSHRRVRRKVERATLKGAWVEAVNPNKVFERDGWACRACGCSTPRHLRGSYHDAAPELDHVIPLSRGGEHSYRNTQLLCRKCNAAKGDGLVTTLVA